MADLRESVHKQVTEIERKAMAAHETSVQRQLEADAIARTKEKERLALERQKEEALAELFSLPTRLNVQSRLEEVRRIYWGGIGTIRTFSDVDRSGVELSTDIPTFVDEYKTISWVEHNVPYTSIDQGGGSHEYREDVRHTRRVVKGKHSAKYPTFLRAGSQNKYGSHFFYVEDSEVDLVLYGSEGFSDLNRMLEQNGIKPSSRRLLGNGSSETYPNCASWDYDINHRGYKGIKYTDSRGYYKDYADTSVHSHRILVPYSSRVSDSAYSEFLDYALAVSCALRKTQGKLPQ